MSTFKNCFLSERPDFNYDITDPEGELIAKAHLLTADDRSYLQRHGMKNSYVNGEMVMDIDLEKYTTATLFKALTWWAWDKKITVESIDDMSKELRQYLSEQINAHETEVAAIVEDAEKN